eukprot:3528498-Prymnesium_polylepis.3
MCIRDSARLARCASTACCHLSTACLLDAVEGRPLAAALPEGDDAAGHGRQGEGAYAASAHSFLRLLIHAQQARGG